MKTLRVRPSFWFVSLCAALCLSACAGRHPSAAKVPANIPLRTASKAELVNAYNELADNLKSINAAVTMQLTAASSYTGVITQYHQVQGFFLAQRPSSIRVIGQVPIIGTNIFDMVSDDRTFQIFIPSRSQFITGPAHLERPSEKPIENLRPQHLLEAVFWQAVTASSPVLVEQEMQSNNSYYVLIVVQRVGSTQPDNLNWQIARKIWFERVGLTMTRIQEYGDAGQVSADIGYTQWDTLGGVRYPRQISLTRPTDGYTLQIVITRLTANEVIPEDRFVLKQPAGTQLVEVGNQTEGAQK